MRRAGGRGLRAFPIVALVGLGCQHDGGAGSTDGGATDLSGDGTSFDSPSSDAGSPDGNSCPGPAPSYCVSSCTADVALVEDLVCVGGAWVCPVRYVIATSCAADACGVTPGECCDGMTGIVSRRGCGADGRRPDCPSGASPTDLGVCVPSALGTDDCSTLDQQPCAAPAVSCRSFAPPLDWSCGCQAYDGAESHWQCGAGIGG